MICTPQVPELRHWYTTPETLHGEPVEIGVNQYIPRVSVLKLDIYIRQFLLQKFPDKFGDKQPQLQKMFSNYVRRPMRVRFGKQVFELAVYDTMFGIFVNTKIDFVIERFQNNADCCWRDGANHRELLYFPARSGSYKAVDSATDST